MWHADGGLLVSQVTSVLLCLGWRGTQRCEIVIVKTGTVLDKLEQVGCPTGQTPLLEGVISVLGFLPLYDFNIFTIWFPRLPWGLYLFPSSQKRKRIWKLPRESHIKNAVSVRHSKAKGFTYSWNELCLYVSGCGAPGELKVLYHPT